MKRKCATSKGIMVDAFTEKMVKNTCKGLEENVRNGYNSTFSDVSLMSERQIRWFNEIMHGCGFHTDRVGDFIAVTL